MKKALALLLVLTFVFAVSFLSFAADAKKNEAVQGTVTKIEGKKLTIKQADGKEVTVEVKNVKDIKVGDKVTVKNGVVTKEKGKEATPAPKKKKAVEGC
ncbi:selenite/tellurite reduction operon protein ExtJ [Thermodesulfovibrio sp. TK110]